MLHACPLSRRHLRDIAFFRLSRGSILASVIRIMPRGPLRVGALYVSGLFVVFYVVVIAQFVWVCEANEEPDITGYVFGSSFVSYFSLRRHERSSPSVPRCIITKQVPIFQTTGESLARFPPHFLRLNYI
jgi:hypothetical protein